MPYADFYVDDFDGVARRATATWGEEAVVLDLAGGPYRFEGLSNAQVLAVKGHWPKYVLPNETKGTTATACVMKVPTDVFKPVATSGWEYNVELRFEEKRVNIAGLRLMGEVAWAPHLQGRLFTSVDGGEYFPGVFENFCRALLSYRLLDADGLVVHSAGLVAPEREAGFLLIGRSGAGKSTASKFARERGAIVLSDDLNALRFRDGVWVIERLPFTGDLRDTAREQPHEAWPLTGIYRLEKTASESLRTLSRAEAFANLLACSPALNRDPYRREQLEATLEKLIASVPAYALRFALSGAFWRLLGGAE